MGKREQLQAGIDSFGYRIAATAQNFADEPSERQGGDGLKYARKLVVYGRALEVLRTELANLSEAAVAEKDVAEEPIRTEYRTGYGWR